MANIPEDLQCLRDRINQDFLNLKSFFNSKENNPTEEESDSLLSRLNDQIDQINYLTDKFNSGSKDIELKKANALTESGTSDSSKSKTFVFSDEGHTLGNALRCVISSYPDVQFCGYTVPHPAEAKMHFRIQMHKGKAIDALKQGLEDLVQVCDITLEKFDEELKHVVS